MLFFTPSDITKHVPREKWRDEADKLSDDADRNKRAKRQNAILLSHFCFLAPI